MNPSCFLLALSTHFDMKSCTRIVSSKVLPCYEKNMSFFVSLGGNVLLVQDEHLPLVLEAHSNLVREADLLAHPEHLLLAQANMVLSHKKICFFLQKELSSACAGVSVSCYTRRTNHPCNIINVS